MNFMFEILVLRREHKIHIFEVTFNVMFIIDILMTEDSPKLVRKSHECCRTFSENC